MWLLFVSVYRGGVRESIAGLGNRGGRALSRASPARWPQHEHPEVTQSAGDRRGRNRLFPAGGAAGKCWNWDEEWTGARNKSGTGTDAPEPQEHRQKSGQQNN